MFPLHSETSQFLRYIKKLISYPNAKQNNEKSVRMDKSGLTKSKVGGQTN